MHQVPDPIKSGSVRVINLEPGFITRNSGSYVFSNPDLDISQSLLPLLQLKPSRSSVVAVTSPFSSLLLLSSSPHETQPLVASSLSISLSRDRWWASCCVSLFSISSQLSSSSFPRETWVCSFLSHGTLWHALNDRVLLMGESRSSWISDQLSRLILKGISVGKTRKIWVARSIY